MTSKPRHTSNSRHRSMQEAAAVSHELRRQAATITQDVRDLAASAGGLLKGQFEPIRRSVVNNPLHAMFIAGGVGFLLGLILRRR